MPLCLKTGSYLTQESERKDEYLLNDISENMLKNFHELEPQTQ